MELASTHGKADELFANAKTFQKKDSFSQSINIVGVPVLVRLKQQDYKTIDMSLYLGDIVKQSSEPQVDLRITPENIINVVTTQTGVRIESADSSTKDSATEIINYLHMDNFWEEG